MQRRGTGTRPPSTGSKPRTPAIPRAGSRPASGVRKARSVRRRSAGLTPTRAGALLALVVGLAGLYGATSSGAFDLRRTSISGVTWTPEDAVLSALDIPAEQNLFLLDTGELADRLSVIPAIRGASITVALPDEVRVDVAERQALLAWQVGADRYLVDQDGMLFGRIDEASPEAASALPVVDDRRVAAGVLAVGGTLDPVLLDAARRLGSLRPADLGTAASRFAITLDDEVGFTLEAQPVGWSAVFGFYTPTLRSTEMIPGQVRLLRSLLAGREDDVKQVILADERSGTYVPRDADASSEPDGSARPDRTLKPDATPTPTDKPPRKTPKPDRTPRPDRTPGPDEGDATTPAP
jgi:cell division protein FtsQ